MTYEKNHSALLAQLTGNGGDYYIGTDAVSTKKFSHIMIGPDGATLTDVKVNNVSVKTARNYPSTLPAGYLIIAGGKNYIDYISLSAGNAEGVEFIEDTYNEL